MGDDKAQRVLGRIGEELQLLWLQMEMWQELFDVEQETRHGLLRTSAPGFFAVLKVTLAESIMMRIARLMDPAKSNGQDNSSLRRLAEVLPQGSHCALVDEIEILAKAWSSKDAGGEYARLKALRDKWLAHNDLVQRDSVPAEELGIPLGRQEFVLLCRLVDQLWRLYRRASVIVRGTDVVEPRHAYLGDRSAALLKCLCASAFLQSQLANMSDEQQFAMRREMDEFEASHMGPDQIREVFLADL